MGTPTLSTVRMATQEIVGASQQHAHSSAKQIQSPGLNLHPTKIFRVFTGSFNKIWINPWEAGLKPDSKRLAFHI